MKGSWQTHASLSDRLGVPQTAIDRERQFVASIAIVDEDIVEHSSAQTKKSSPRRLL